MVYLKSRVYEGSRNIGGDVRWSEVIDLDFVVEERRLDLVHAMDGIKNISNVVDTGAAVDIVEQERCSVLGVTLVCGVACRRHVGSRTFRGGNLM